MSPESKNASVLARAIRKHVLQMVHRAGASHVGSCLSAADILAVLYSRVLRQRPAEPDWPDRDRFILSKGHAAAAVYAALAECGYFPEALLSEFCSDGSLLTGHISHAVPGVELSTGSLGHGLSVGVGMALAAQMDGAAFRVFVLLSDGECDEGSVWEAALYAGHQRLDRLTALIDYNKIQSFGRVADVIDLEPLADKWRAFGWTVVEVDGHDAAALEDALSTCGVGSGRPTLVLCHTTKGKGVSYMEDQLVWHYRSPSDAQLAQALNEIDSAP